jgi:hypothetical protein
VRAGNDAYVAGRDLHLTLNLNLNVALPAEVLDEDDRADLGFGGAIDSPRRGRRGPAREVVAEWALWGKDASKLDYEVLGCSQGTFGPGDFAAIIARYSSGAMRTLPQYTVGWLPDQDGNAGYLAIGIHERADPDPRRSGDRARSDRAGREIQYIRLFCVRYMEMADHAVSYSELVDAVWEHQLPASDGTPIPVELREIGHPSFAHPNRGLAEAVATLLLTTDPVCILGAERLPAENRLKFIDQVVSLLPYGLRATLSASTWADMTAQRLPLRLYFADAPRSDGGRTRYVTWDRPAVLGLPQQEHPFPQYYQDWLRHVGPGAEVVLADMTAPIRFHPDAIASMVRALPTRRPVSDHLEEIAAALHRGDQPGVRVALSRLKRELDMTAAPGSQQEYQQAIESLGLLRNYARLSPGMGVALYRVLLRLAFEVPFSYHSYCAIEDSAGGQPSDTLRRVLLELGFSEILPFLVAANSEPAVTDEDLMTVLHRQDIPATAPLTEFQQRAATTRPWHRPAGYDLAVQYLLKFAEDPRTELARRRYLADTLEAAFPGSQRDQQARLEDILRFIYGEGLSKDQVSELYARQGPLATPAFRDAVTSLASPPMPDDPASRQAPRKRALIGTLAALVVIAAVILVIYKVVVA